MAYIREVPQRKIYKRQRKITSTQPEILSNENTTAMDEGSQTDFDRKGLESESQITRDEFLDKRKEFYLNGRTGQRRDERSYISNAPTYTIKHLCETLNDGHFSIDNPKRVSDLWTNVSLLFQEDLTNNEYKNEFGKWFSEETEGERFLLFEDDRIEDGITRAIIRYNNIEVLTNYGCFRRDENGLCANISELNIISYLNQDGDGVYFRISERIDPKRYNIDEMIRVLQPHNQSIFSIDFSSESLRAVIDNDGILYRRHAAGLALSRSILYVHTYGESIRDNIEENVKNLEMKLNKLTTFTVYKHIFKIEKEAIANVISGFGGHCINFLLPDVTETVYAGLGKDMLGLSLQLIPQTQSRIEETLFSEKHGGKIVSEIGNGINVNSIDASLNYFQIGQFERNDLRPIYKPVKDADFNSGSPRLEEKLIPFDSRNKLPETPMFYYEEVGYEGIWRTITASKVLKFQDKYCIHKEYKGTKIKHLGVILGHYVIRGINLKLNHFIGIKFDEIMEYRERFQRKFVTDISLNETTFSNVDFNVSIENFQYENLEFPALVGRSEIEHDVNDDKVYVFACYHFSIKDNTSYTFSENIEIANVVKDLLVTAETVKFKWIFPGYNLGPQFVRDVTTRVKFTQPFECNFLKLPYGFSNVKVYSELSNHDWYNIISGVILREQHILVDLGAIQDALQEITKVTSLLVQSVNNLQKQFQELQKHLAESSHVPWWKKVLSVLGQIGGLIGTILLPIAFPIGIGLLAASTLITTGLAFSEGDYWGGAIQVVGLVVGVGVGFYQFRKASNSSYTSAKLKAARVVEQDFPKEFDMRNRLSDGLWIEQRPLKFLGDKVESIGTKMVKTNSILNRTLLSLDAAPVHARVRSQTTKVVDGKVIRKTLVSGVTDGMPYISHSNPRPGIYQLLEEYDSVSNSFQNAWNKANVPTTNVFDEIPTSIKGMLLEGNSGVGYNSLKTTWASATLDERAIFLNEAQNEIKSTVQGAYSEVPKSRIPISFDDSLVENVMGVFAKHTGLYELTGLTGSNGPNNCQTYAKEIRNFMANGAISTKKINNTAFINDLLLGIDSSFEFSTVYGPVLEKK
nr:MAG: hypothetical protein [Planococcus ficus-associated reovirus 1]